MPVAQEQYSKSYGYTYTVRKRRSKADWAGVGIGDAFNNDLDYYQRLPAQRELYRLIGEAQKRVARKVDSSFNKSQTLKLKPQISPCYTSYPSNWAAQSSIGLTAYLECAARSRHNFLFSRLTEYFLSPVEKDKVIVDGDSYYVLTRLVARTVYKRLILEELRREYMMPSVEIYRLFSCSQQKIKFRTIKEVLQAVILFGDVMPRWESLGLHPATYDIMKGLTKINKVYLKMLPLAEPRFFVGMGENWVRDICKALAPYLPSPKQLYQQPPLDDAQAQPKTMRGAENKTVSKMSRTQEANSKTPDRIAPLEGLMPPVLDDPKRASDHVVRSMCMPQPGEEEIEQGQIKRDKALRNKLGDFSQTMEQAGGQARDWEDLRYEIAEEIMGSNSFNEGPVAGTPTYGSEVMVSLRGGITAKGDIFDRPLELSEDFVAIEALRADASPVTDQLKRNLYPNLDYLPDTLRLRTSGALDGGRLSLAGFSSTVFKRFHNVEKADRRGRPVLAIACDGSGSLNGNQMRMLKILATAWLESIVGSEIQLLAGLYHSGFVRPLVSGPLVQWLYHPQKTPSLGLSDGIRAVASLPESGRGVQSDALSLSFIMSEARHIAAGGMIYLIVLSDTAWNSSFEGELNGREEVICLFEELHKELGRKLNTTLVALGVEGETGFEDLLDKVIAVSNQDLNDPASVAGLIGDYVSSCLRRQARPTT